MIQNKMLKPVELSFEGNAGEYFRIWIVNILLSILTLGVYSAWAKVRNKQYFYGNTILDGSPFEYSASPVAILMGRMVVVAILAIYSLTVHLFPLSDPFFILAFFIVLPWLVMRSMMFNARYSSYRNLNFSFESNLKDAVVTFIGIGLLMLLTLGLIYPYYMHSIQKYRIDNHGYGQYRFDFKSAVKAFYKYYFIALLILILVAFIGSAIFGALFGSSMSALLSGGNPDGMPNVGSAGIMFILIMITVYLFAYLAAFAYIKTKVFNTVWSNTELNKATTLSMTAPSVPLIAFKGALETRQMMLIYFTNTIGIIVSMGLLIPWAKVRLAKYRIENLSVMSIANLGIISAKEREHVGTIGSEMSDILDIDIGM